MRRHVIKITMFTLLIATALIGFSGRAEATPSDSCTVTHVVMSPSSVAGSYTNRYLSIQCADGTFYIVFTQLSNASSSCFVDIDTMKMWQSIATSAKLSGAPLLLFYNPTTGCPGGGTPNIIAVLDF